MSAFKAFGRVCSYLPGDALGEPEGADKRDVQAVTEALERARVVAVLDGWAQANPGWAWRCIETGARCCCEGVFIHNNREPLNDERFDCYGPTPDAARAAAARAIEAGEV